MKKFCKSMLVEQLNKEIFQDQLDISDGWFGIIGQKLIIDTNNLKVCPKISRRYDINELIVPLSLPSGPVELGENKKTIEDKNQKNEGFVARLMKKRWGVVTGGDVEDVKTQKTKIDTQKYVDNMANDVFEKDLCSDDILHAEFYERRINFYSDSSECEDLTVFDLHFKDELSDDELKDQLSEDEYDFQNVLGQDYVKEQNDTENETCLLNIQNFKPESVGIVKMSQRRYPYDFET
eukprot:UN30578